MKTKRLSLLSLLFFLCVVPIIAQTTESDSLFAQGVALYKKLQYADAIPFFEKCDSVDRITLNKGSSRRSYGAIWLASCWYKLGDKNKAESYYKYYNHPPIDRRLTVKSDSLSDISKTYAAKRDYANAAKYAIQCADLEKKNLGDNSFWYANSIFNIAYYLYAIGDASYSNYLESSISIYSNLGLKDEVDRCRMTKADWYVYGRIKAAEETYQKGLKEESYNILRMAEDTMKAYSVKDDGLQAYLFTNLGMLSHDLKKNSAAASFYYICAAELYHKLGNFNMEGLLWNNTGDLEFSDAKWSDAYKHYSCALESFGMLKDLTQKAAILQKMGSCKASSGEYEVAYSLRKHAYNILADSVSGDNKNANFAYLMYKLGTTCSNLQGRKTEMLDWMHKAKALYEEIGDTLNYNYFENEANLMLIADNDKYSEADSLIRAFVRKYDNGIFSKTEYFFYALCLREQLAVDNAERKYYCLKAKKLAEGNGYSDNDKYVQMLMDLENVYVDENNFGDAYDVLKEALTCCEKSNNTSDYAHITILHALGIYFNLVNDSYNALKYFDKAEELTKNANLDDNTRNYLFNVFLISKTKILIEAGRNKEALEKCNEFLNNPKRSSSLLASVYSFKGNALHGLLRYQEAEKAFLTADSLATLEKDSMLMLRVKYLTLQNREKAGRIRKSIWDLTGQKPLERVSFRQVDELLEMAKHLNAPLKLYNDLLSSKLICLITDSSASDYYSLNQLVEFINEVDSFNRKEIIDNFQNMTYRQRTLYSAYRTTWFLSTMPSFMCIFKDSRLCSMAYNDALFCKGLLLNSELELQKQIQKSGNSKAIELYNDVKDGRERLNALQQQHAEGKEYVTLYQSMEEKERKLVDAISSQGNYMQSLKTSWEDVRSALKPGEIAVEFLFPKYIKRRKDGISLDKQEFVAIVVEHGSKAPKLFHLCNIEQIARLPEDSLYTTDKLYRYFWQPILDSLKDVKTVYFSPESALYSMAIEYAPMSDGRPINEKYAMFRVSSTREVALRNEEHQKGSGDVLYGGLKYDANVASIEKTIGKDRSTSVKPRAALQEDAGVPYLKGTLTEVNDIAKMLLAAGRKCEKLTDERGTEESLKALSGKNIALLHIATHGFYWGGNDNITEDGDTLVSISANSNLYDFMDGSTATTGEDSMLTQSGLILAGANTALRGEPLPADLEDGILTSQELSMLDFSGLDLVVLSACESGLGNISGDGVFGLQRGFKKAGAQSLLMSLWKVDDEATQLLMTYFYRNLLNGDSKPLALAKAQQTLRETDGGRFNNPHFWAAFILLDAIE